jgi:HSP20 family molecular chaperone IbpA
LIRPVWAAVGQSSYNPQTVANKKTEEESEKMENTPVPVTVRDFFFEDPFFKTSWADFEQVREAMFQESRDMWKKFDEDFRQMACMSSSVSMSEKQNEEPQNVEGDKALQRQDSLSKWENSWMFPRRWMMPSLRSELGNLDLFKGKDSEVIRTKEDNEKMEVSLDTAQYRPNELKVTVVGDMICVEGKHEEKAEDGSRMVASQFVRKYSLPKGAKPEDVTSNLSSDGVLVITAKKPNPAIESKSEHK